MYPQISCLIRLVTVQVGSRWYTLRTDPIGVAPSCFPSYRFCLFSLEPDWFSLMQNRACTHHQSGKGMPWGICLRPIRGGEVFGACLSCQRFSVQSSASSLLAFFFCLPNGWFFWPPSWTRFSVLTTLTLPWAWTVGLVGGRSIPAHSVVALLCRAEIAVGITTTQLESLNAVWVMGSQGWQRPGGGT